MKSNVGGQPLVIVTKSKADRKAAVVKVPPTGLEKLNMGQKLREDGTEEAEEMET